MGGGDWAPDGRECEVDETAGERPYHVQDLGIGDILDHALYLLRDHWKTLTAIAVVIGLPFYLVAAVVQVWATPESIDAIMAGETPEEVNPLDIFYMTIIPIITSMVLFVFGMPLMAAALTHNAAMAYFGAPATAKQSIRVAIRLFPKVVVCAFVYGMMCFIGGMLCVIPGILAQCAFFLYIPLLVLENAPLTEAFTRSMRLMKGFMWVAFLLILAINLLGMVSGASSFFYNNYDLQSVIGFGLSVVLAALQAVVATVLYCAARCRHEHLDLDLAAGRADDLSPEPAL